MGREETRHGERKGEIEEEDWIWEERSLYNQPIYPRTYDISPNVGTDLWMCSHISFLKCGKFWWSDSDKCRLILISLWHTVQSTITHTHKYSTSTQALSNGYQYKCALSEGRSSRDSQCVCALERRRDELVWKRLVCVCQSLYVGLCVTWQTSNASLS